MPRRSGRGAIGADVRPNWQERAPASLLRPIVSHQNNSEPVTCWYEWSHRFSPCVYALFLFR